jgi:alpha-tubulin suppressor-like RCC1 family protein
MAHAFRLSLALFLLGGLAACGSESDSPTGPQAAVASAAAEAGFFLDQVTAGGFHSCGLSADGRAWCWGLGNFGELGTGDTASHRRPVAVAGPRRYRQISAGTYHTCAVGSDSLAYCWGQNDYGQLGNNSIRPKFTPVRVQGLRKFVQVDAGPLHTCGVTTAGVTFCWGANFGGQLGNGTTVNSRIPVKVAGGHTARRVSVGGNSCLLTPEGKAWCWGNPTGDGTNLTRTTPVAVAGNHVFRTVAAGGPGGCGLTAANVGWCWGYNANGGVGDGTTTDRFTPVRVTGGLLFKQLVTGAATCGVTTGDRAYCWGTEFAGSLGNGGADHNEPAPSAVLGGLSFQGVSPGDYHGCGLTLSHQAYCWGHNAYGQLGNGIAGPDSLYGFPVSLTPVKVVAPS